MTTEHDARIRRYIATVGDLPSVPGLASRVLKVVEDPSASADDLRRVIEGDPAVAARILKTANSSLYSFSRRIETLQHAISLLGFRSVGNIVLAVALKEVFKHFGLTEKLLWEHATAAGAVAMRLARYPGVGVGHEEAFTAGLLHDLGKIAFHNTSRQKYTEVFARVYNEGLSFVEAERDAFGFDHAALGAEVAVKWKLPKLLEAAIRHHHAPGMLEKLEERERRLTALVTVTTACCTRLGAGRRHPVEDLEVESLPAWAALGLRDDDLEPVLARAAEEVERSAGSFG